MPLVKVHMSEAVDGAAARGVLADMSRIVATRTGKSEAYVMVTMDTGPVLMNGREVTGCFIDIRSIGRLDQATNTAITQDLCALLSSALHIDPEAVYVSFTDVEGSMWGWNNRTFG